MYGCPVEVGDVEGDLSGKPALSRCVQGYLAYKKQRPPQARARNLLADDKADADAAPLHPVQEVRRP